MRVLFGILAVVLNLFGAFYLSAAPTLTVAAEQNVATWTGILLVIAALASFVIAAQDSK